MTEMDKIFEIIAKGNDIRNSDLIAIRELSLEMSPEDFDDKMPWVWEAIALIVNAPEYEGDCEPID